MKPGLLWSIVRAMPIVLAGLLTACSVGQSGPGDEIVPGTAASQPKASSSTAPSAHNAGTQAAHSVAHAVGQADPANSAGAYHGGLAASAAVSTTIDLPHIHRSFEGTPPAWWQPPPNTSWQWQLTDPIDLSFDVDMYDIDLFDNTASTVGILHAQGRMVLCYVSVGSWEEWRPDADQFPESVLGNDYEGWPGERWLDIRQIELLAPIMRARFDVCQAKGFDGIEPDNIDGYTNDTGFPLTYQDQLNYNIWLASEAHARGLSIGLKNDDEQVGDLLPHFDWAMTEDCYADEWCTAMEPFIAAGKAIFAAEYTDQMTINQFLNQVCPQAEALDFSAILKHRDLGAWRRGCP